MENKLNKIESDKSESISPELLTELREVVSNYASDVKLVPPLSQEEIFYHTEKIITSSLKFTGLGKWIAVLINNKAWEPVVSEIPFERRILLIPKCFRNTEKCEAVFDELGLLCEVCGNCYTGEIITKAEEKGYNVVVSEGTTTVSRLLSSQQVECVIGIGCIDSFEKTFPLAVKHAIPALALPLYNSDCKNSKVDEVWVEEICSLCSETKNTNFINIEKSREIISSWFELENLKTIFNEGSKTEQIGVQWLSSGGKFWRPLLTASIYNVLSGNKIEDNQTLMNLAVAVECFHKASLIHDDIADNDLERYGKPVLHREFDIPIALNLGDLLIAYGYEQISKLDLSTEKISGLTAIASRGHKELCVGQGEELLWRHNSEFHTVDEILYIFRMKTSPAFEVALKFGAVAADVSEDMLKILGEFSKYLGIAYQIKDDIDDYYIDAEKHDFSILRPSLIYSLVAEKESETVAGLFSKIKTGDEKAADQFAELIEKYSIVETAKEMFQNYKAKTFNALNECENPSVKILLYRLVNKILKD